MTPTLRTLAAAFALAWPLAIKAAALDVHVQDMAGQPLAGAVVSVLPDGPVQLAQGATAQMAQKNRTFVPHVLVVQAGTAVQFPNLDTVRHHVYSFSAIKPFEIKLYAATPVAPIVFDKPGTAVLGCNIHDRMSAFIHVVGTPYYATTDTQGNAHLAVPDGELRLQIWHPMYTDAYAPPVQVYRPAMGTHLNVVLKPPGGP